MSPGTLIPCCVVAANIHAVHVSWHSSVVTKAALYAFEDAEATKLNPDLDRFH